MITAHSGANGTKPNSTEFLSKISEYRSEVIEVDVRMRRGTLIVFHNPCLSPKGKTTLREVFEAVKATGVKVNCDMKESGAIFYKLLALAEEIGVTENLIFTGEFKKNYFDNPIHGVFYLNSSGIFKKFHLKVSVETLEKCKSIIDGLGENVRGINLSYKFATPEFLAEAKRIDLPLSFYTVQDAAVYEKLLEAGVENITSLKPTAVWEARNRICK